MNLQAAQTQLAAGHPEKALPLLLKAWREIPAVSLARLIEQVAAQLKPAPLPVGTAKARHQAFLTLAAKKRPEDLGPLLAQLGTGQTAQFVQALDALAPWPADPRLTTRAIELFQRPPVTSSASFPAWRKLFQLLADWGDWRAVEALERLDFLAILTQRLKWSADWFQDRAAKTVAMMRAARPAGPPSLTAADEALIAAMSKGQRAARQDEASLLEAVYADPSSDGPRQVLADLWLEKNDPRGEFTILQFARAAGTQTPEQARREAELLAEHRTAWLGPLAAGLLKDFAWFERGFPVQLSLDWLTPARIKQLEGLKEWATVRSLHLLYRDEDPLHASFLRSPALKSIVSFGAVCGQSLLDLWTSSTPWPYAEVVSTDPAYEARQFKKDLALLSTCPALPNLTSLKLSGYLIKPEQYAPFWKSATASRLTGFGVSNGIAELPGWVAQVEQHGLDARLTSFDLSFNFGRHGFAVHLTRGADGRLSQLEISKRPKQDQWDSQTTADLVERLDGLPADRLTGFRYLSRLPKSEKAALEKSLSRQTKLTHLFFM